jgi:hypothetical protein
VRRAWFVPQPPVAAVEPESISCLSVDAARGHFVSIGDIVLPSYAVYNGLYNEYLHLLIAWLVVELLRTFSPKIDRFPIGFLNSGFKFYSAMAGTCTCVTTGPIDSLFDSSETNRELFSISILRVRRCRDLCHFTLMARSNS